jgi:hypothetical protein
MLRFEREVVAALGSARDQPTRSAVEAFVDGSLRAMPEPIRAGVLGETLLLGTWARLRGPDDLAAMLTSWETSRISVVRQYVHMFRSLVLFAENELSEGSQLSGPPGSPESEPAPESESESESESETSEAV